MAKGDGKTLEKLYLELGLDLSTLQSDLLAAERTVTENLGRLNRERNTIRLRVEAETAGLDRVKDAAKILEIQEKGLNQELALSKDRLAILEAAYKQVANNANSTALAVQNAEKAFLKEKIAVANLQQQLKTLNSQKVVPPTNNLLSNYQSLKENTAGKFSELSNAISNLQNATGSADGAVTSLLSVIGNIPRPVGAAVAALIGVPLIIKGIENSLIDLTKAAASSGDAVYVMSRGFQMSVADTGKFTTNAKVAGVQVNDLANAVKMVQRQIARGGEDSRAAEWIKRYGQSAYNASGNLKDLNEMTLALSSALKAAQADGKGAEFVLNVFRNVSADAITAIEDWADVSAQAATIVKAGLANPKLAHEVQGNLNAMGVQAAQLNTSFTNALLPVANEIVPRVTERMGKMTQIIKDNKDVILDLGRDFAKVWGAVEDTIDNVADGVGEITKLARENRVVRQTDTKTVVERYKDNKNVQTAEDILKREIAAGSYSAEDVTRLRARNDLYKKELERHNQDLKAILAERRKDFAKLNKPILDKYKYNESIKTATDLLNKLTDAEKETIEQAGSGFGSLIEKVAALNLELQNIHKSAEQAKGEVKDFKSVAYDFSTAGQERRNLGDDQIEQLRNFRKYEENAAVIMDKLNLNDYEYKKSELQRWIQEQLPRDVEHSLAECQAVMKEAGARDAQIEQERADKLKEIRDSVEAAEKTALQNKLDNIEKERQAWIKAGMDEVEAVELAQKRKAKAYEEANAKIQEHLKNAANIEFELTHSAFEKQLRDIEQWRDAQAKKAESAEETASIIAEAAAKEARAFESEMDRIRGKLQSLDDKIFAIDHSQFENDIRKVNQDYANQMKDFFSQGLLTPEIQEKLDYYRKRQLQELNKKAAESRKSGSDYTKSPKGQQGWGVIDFNAKPEPKIPLQADISQFEAKFSQGLSQQAQGIIAATKATNELAEAQRQLTQETQNAAKGFEVVGWGEGGGITQMQGGFEVVGWGDTVPTLVNEFDGNVEKLNESVLGATTTLSDFAALKEQYNQNVLQEKTLTSGLQLETVVTPLNSIQSTLSQILAAVNSRQQSQQITISSNVSNNLGGAYVFDNAMKQELVNDITANVVEELKKSLQQATRKQNLSYSA